MALDEKKMDVMNIWIKGRIKKTYISIDKDYQKCTFQREWKKSQ
jgi:peptidyl-prolyl cis-trans isomerase SurA